ncbi:MAG: hypothetical protein ACFFA6_14200 [Promethearchaeota archaeon]
MEKCFNKSESPTFLMRKLLTICPICKRPVYGRDIEILKIDKSMIKRWSLKYTFCHSHNKGSLHAITIYLDAIFTVRGNEISDFIKIEKV